MICRPFCSDRFVVKDYVFERQLSRLLSASCVSCHQQKAVDYDRYRDVHKDKSAEQGGAVGAAEETHNEGCKQYENQKKGQGKAEYTFHHSISFNGSQSASVSQRS